MTRISIDVHLTPAELRRALIEDARTGLTAAPKWLPPKWFYDERGCELFDDITRLDEYYPTRREREILSRRAGEIATLVGADTLVELGSGTSEKTRLLLGALVSAGTLRRFAPFDVSEPTLAAACDSIAAEFPSLELHGVVGDFERHLDTIPGGDRRLVAFLGGTIGNLVPEQRSAFLAALAATLAPGDWFLLGADQVKDPDRIRAAYDDPAGVTAAFNRNILHVLNRELGATFEPEQFEHVVIWDPDHEWIEMRLRSETRQRVDVRDLELTVEFRAGEETRTEVSSKFRRGALEAELIAHGLEPVRWWTDEAGDFAVSLSVLRSRPFVAPPPQ